jgi:electron transfer flavoprotein alpha subunit
MPASPRWARPVLRRCCSPSTPRSHTTTRRATRRRGRRRTRHGASVVLMAASSIGKDLAPRVAALLGVGLASDCTALETTGGKLIARRPVMAARHSRSWRSRSRPRWPRSGPRRSPLPRRGGEDGDRGGRWHSTGTRPHRAPVVTGVSGASGDKADLTEAEIIVSGGRGMKGPENFALIEKLAEALGRHGRRVARRGGRRLAAARRPGGADGARP